MEWSRRYAMAKGDDIPTLLGKIKNNASTYFPNANAAPHQWVARYFMTAKEHGADSHEELRKACYKNSDEARHMAQNQHKSYYAHTKMWRQLGDLHSDAQREAQQ